MNINNIFKLKEKKEIIFKEMIINNLKKRKHEKLKQYKFMLNSCIKLIEQSINDNQTDILFTISSTIPNCSDYNSDECLKYIQKKLLNNNLNTLIIDSNNIFITWKNIKI